MAARRELLKYLDHGGLPGIFSVRSELDRESQAMDTLDLILLRDITQYRDVDPDACRRVLECVATLKTPSSGEIAKTLRLDPRKVKRYLDILRELFVIHRLEPNSLGAGKDLYFIYDTLMAKTLGASFDRRMETWLLNEQLSQHSYRDLRKTRMSFFQTSRGSRIHLILESLDEICAVKLIPDERIDLRQLEVLLSFSKKVPTRKKVRLIALAPVHEVSRVKGVEIHPWEAIV